MSPEWTKPRAIGVLNIVEDNTMVQKNKVKQIIKDQGLRISPESFDGINREVINLISLMCKRVKEDNMKTLQSQHTHISNGVHNVSRETVDEQPICNRCGSVPDYIMDVAYSIRANAEDYAKILHANWKRAKR